MAYARPNSGLSRKPATTAVVDEQPKCACRSLGTFNCPAHGEQRINERLRAIAHQEVNELARTMREAGSRTYTS